MIPFSDPRFPGDAKASHFQLVLRRRPDGKLPGLDSGVLEELSQIIAYLEALRTDIKDTKQGSLHSPGATQRAEPHALNSRAFRATSISAEQGLSSLPQLTLPRDRDLLAKKLRLARARLESRPNEEPALSEEDLLQSLALLTDSKLLAEENSAGEPKAEIPAAFLTREPAPSTAWSQRARRLLALVGTASLAVLGTVVFLWSRPAAVPQQDHADASPATENTASSEVARTADLVLRSIQRGRLEEASGLLADASKRGSVLPGLRYQAALLALRQGDVRASVDWISQSIAAREAVPECLYLRANAAATAGDYAAVCESFGQAAGAAPFSPRYFFFWGEALRRYGHPAEALPQFERALLCRPSSTESDLIHFKMGLAEIEAGADERFESRLQFLLAQKNVSGDALLLAAAAEINRVAYPAAAEYLQRAKQTMPPALLAARLRDFLFQARSRQPDLAAAWPAAVPTGPSDPNAPTRQRIGDFLYFPVDGCPDGSGGAINSAVWRALASSLAASSRATFARSISALFWPSLYLPSNRATRISNVTTAANSRRSYSSGIGCMSGVCCATRR